MKINQKMLRKIILQEIRKANSGKRRIAEGSRGNPVKVTTALINRLIREEYAAFKNQQRIVEARRRRLVEARRRRLIQAKRRRRLAEARRRKETVYYY